MSSSGDGPLYSDTAANDEAAALVVVPNPTTASNETPAYVDPDEARSLSTIANPNPVLNANTPSGPATFLAMLLEFEFSLTSGEADAV